jgi:tetratricopeptide (TPR) repeat protein
LSRPSVRTPAPLERAYQAATAAHRQGKLEEATELYRAVLRLDRDHFETLNNLGILRARQGSAAEAERLLQRAVKQRPHSAEAHSNLAQALRALNRHKDATAHSAEATFLQSSQAAMARGDWLEAERWYRSALERDPRRFDALANLGLVCIRTGRLEEAAPLLRQALELRPQAAEVHNALGSVLRTLGRPEEAVSHFRRALALKADYAEAHANLGNALGDLARFEAAAASLRRAVALKPDFAPARRDLATVLQTLGQLDAARETLDKAISDYPGDPSFYRILGDLKRFSADDPHLTTLETLAKNVSALLPDQQVELHFALGKAYADLERHELSFQHLLAGNRLARQGIDYDEAATLRLFERMRAVFGAELLRDAAGRGDPTDLPVFIIGMPRSGTTLVEQILASHPMVAAGGELEELTHAIARHHETIQKRMDYPELVASLDATDFRAIGANYRNAVATKAGGKPRLTDKLPANFLHAGLIPLVLPNARIIHTRRNPLDTCLSCFSILFKSGHLKFSYDLAEVGRYYRAYAALMEHWRHCVPPGVMLEVDYEDLITDFEGQVRRMLAHCGLPWDDACRDFHRTDRPVYTASSRQVRQPVYRSSVARSQPYQHLLGPLLEALSGER